MDTSLTLKDFNQLSNTEYTNLCLDDIRSYFSDYTEAEIIRIFGKTIYATYTKTLLEESRPANSQIKPTSSIDSEKSSIFIKGQQILPQKKFTTKLKLQQICETHNIINEKKGKNNNSVRQNIDNIFKETIRYVKKMGIEAYYPKLIRLFNNHADSITDEKVVSKCIKYAKKLLSETGNRDYELMAKIFEIRIASLQPETEKKVMNMRRDQMLLSTELIQEFFEYEEELDAWVNNFKINNIIV